jgi:hypothetical protein
MIFRTATAALALLLTPALFAQTANAQQTTIKPPDGAGEEAPLFFYGAGGFAWSGELGFEIEAGVQADLGDAIRFRFSPINISLFDGDVPSGFYWENGGFGYDCRETGSNALAIDDECRPETDAEWRSVAEIQFKLSDAFSIGGGATYLLQGDFLPEDGRVSPFASFSWAMEDDTSLELRAGGEYFSLQLRSRW